MKSLWHLVSILAMAVALLSSCTSSSGTDIGPTASPTASPSPIPSRTRGPTAAPDVVVTLCPEWFVGDSRSFEITSTQIRSEPGEQDVIGTAKTSVQVEVLEASDDGYLFRWTLGETRPVQPSTIDLDTMFMDDPSLEALINLVRGAAIDVWTDACGLYGGIANIDELVPIAQGVGETVLSKLAGIDGFDPEMSESLLSTITSPAFIEHAYGKYAAIYYDAYGEAYRLGKPAEYDGDLLNPMGGAPLPATFTYSLEHYDQPTGCGTIAVDGTVDPEDLESFFLDMMLEFDPEATPGGDLSVSMENHTEYRFCDGEAWMRSATTQRDVRIGPGRRFDSIDVREIID